MFALSSLFVQPVKAWEARADKVDARLASRPTPHDARQLTMPGWARRVRAPGEKVFWREGWQGKTYWYGVGFVEGASNPSLRAAIAEDRARASLTAAVGTVTGGTATLPNGEPVVKTETQATLVNSRALDWYMDPDGGMYALVVLVQ